MQDYKKEKPKYLVETARNLVREGIVMEPIEHDTLHVTLGGKRLCWVSGSGIGYYREDISGDDSREVLDRVREIAEVTREYMSALEQSPSLKAKELEDGYRVLSEFNNTVLAGKATRYGAQFVTWEWAGEQTILWQGHCYGPAGGTAAYAADNKRRGNRGGCHIQSHRRKL